MQLIQFYTAARGAVTGQAMDWPVLQNAKLESMVNKGPFRPSIAWISAQKITKWTK